MEELQLEVVTGSPSASPLIEDRQSLVEFAHQAGHAFTAGITRDEQKAAGQFMTPPKIAKFMAQRLVRSVDHQHVRLLEPSAGGGVLIAAAVEALLEKPDLPAIIEALLYEQDQQLIPALEALCQRIGEVCAVAGVRFEYVIRGEDFLLSDLALRGEPVDGLLTIANPPFFKLNKTTDERAHRHGYAVYGQPNVYGLFMAATARLTPANGRWCFIVPRSWMNGQYFKAVRHTMLRHLTMDSLIRVMNRLGRGYSFEALRAKILFTEGAHKNKLSRPKFELRREPELAVAEEVMGYGVPDDAMGYGLPPGHFGKAVLTPRKNVPKAEHPHEPPGPPKNYGADINTLIELLESGRL